MEYNTECPESIKDKVSSKLIQAMEKGAQPFCTRLKLSADASIGTHWIH